MVSNQVGAPASGAQQQQRYRRSWLGCFQSSGGPSEWGHNQAFCPAIKQVASFQSSGGPSEWGPWLVTRPPSELFAVFPIKWGPQRVGPRGSFQTYEVRLRPSGFQSSGGPSEWGHAATLTPWILQTSCFQSSGGPSEWGLRRARFLEWLPKFVSNQVGAPASGAIRNKSR